MIHLGYLTYHEAEKTARIPNEEVRIEFKQFLVQRGVNSGWIALIRCSQKLLEDTIDGRNDDVAAALDEIRTEQYAPQFYNNEQTLRTIIKYAYLREFFSKTNFFEIGFYLLSSLRCPEI